MIVDEEHFLFEAHVAALQENADLLQQEGSLLGALQRPEPDVDFGEYARRLRELLETKVATAQALLKRVEAFQLHLAIEEEVSARIDASASAGQVALASALPAAKGSGAARAR
jgi:hypothetical protein